MGRICQFATHGPLDPWAGRMVSMRLREIDLVDDEAGALGWSLISFKNDWKSVYTRQQ
jgi:hypothetical protein